MENGLNYSTTQINRDFLINFQTRENGRRVRHLIGVSTLVEKVGEVLANKFIERAYASAADVCVCKLRRGIQFGFYAH